MARVKSADKDYKKKEPLLTPLRRVAKEKDEVDKNIDEVMPFSKDAPRETTPVKVAPGSVEEKTLQKDIAKEQTIANAEKPSVEAKAEEKMKEEEKLDPNAEEEKSFEEGGDEFMDDASYENEEEPTIENVRNRLTGRENSRETPNENDRPKMEKGFTQALAYFGPRLFAQLAGGNSAAEATDKIMKGFEGYQRGEKQDEQKDRELDIKDKAASRQAPEDKEQSLAERKFSYKKQQDMLKRQQEEAKLDQETQSKQFNQAQKLEKFDKALKGLIDEKGNIKGGVTGLFDSTLGAGWDKITGGKDRATRLLLEELKVQEGVAKTALLAGQISDREYKSLVEKPAPSEYDDEKTWVRWLQANREVASKIDPSSKNYLDAVGSKSSGGSSVLNKYGLK